MSGSTGFWPIEVTDLKNADTRAVVLWAASIGGWTIVQRVNSQWTLIALDGTTINVPTNTGLKSGVFRSMVRKIVRHSHPATCADPSCAEIDRHWPDEGVVHQIAKHVKLDASHEAVMLNAYRDAHREARTPTAPEPVAAASPAPVRPPAPAPVAATPTPPAPPKQEEPTRADTPERKPKRLARPDWVDGEVKDRRPRIAKNNTTAGHPSHAVDVLTLVDGHTAYGCRWPGCDWRDPSPKSVAMHYAAVHAEGRTRLAATMHDPTLAQTPVDHRRDSRIARLAAELEQAWSTVMKDGLPSPSKLAEAIVDARISRAEDDAERAAEPLTAEQVLDRIAVLVDRGRTAELTDRVAELEAALAARTVELTEALGNLGALVDLVEGLRPRVQGGAA